MPLPMIARPAAEAFRGWLLCACAALLAFSGCSGKKPSGDPATAARTFLEQVLRGETAAAHASAAFAFRSQQSQKAFDSTVRELGLVGAQLTSLTLADQQPATAKFDALITPAKGDLLPFVVTLQRESDAWRLFSLRSPRNPKTGVSENRFTNVGKTTAFNEALNKSIPAEREVRRMVRQSMGAFAEAIQQRSFVDFYNHVSQAWQAQLTQKQLQRAFQGFIDQDVNLAGVADVEPLFDGPPQVTTDGLLQVSGNYPTKPFEVVFAFKFIYELPEWKLFGLDVFLRKAAEAPKPAATPAAAPPAPPAPTPAQ